MPKPKKQSNKLTIVFLLSIALGILLASAEFSNSNIMEEEISSLKLKAHSIEIKLPYTQWKDLSNEAQAYEMVETLRVTNQPTYQCNPNPTAHTDGCNQSRSGLPQKVFPGTDMTTDVNLTETKDKADETKNNNSLQEVPDMRCLFDPELPNCSPDKFGKCPNEFTISEDERCVPLVGCPTGYHKVEDDESGRCYSNEEGCPSDMIFNPKYGDCEYKDYVCRDFPYLEECI
jgi:hypothetical protein